MGTMKMLGNKPGATALDIGEKSINLISPEKLDSITQAIRELSPQVTVAPADAEVQVDVHVPELRSPDVQVTNEVTPADVTVNSTNIIEFSAKHVYWALVLHAFLMFAAGIGAYVTISKFHQYLNPAYGLRAESGSGLPKL